VLALTEPAFSAKSAETARGGERGHDAVTRLEALDLGSNFLDHPDEFVPERLADRHRDVAVIDVEVRAADRSERDLDQGLPRAGDARLGGIDHLDVPLALVCSYFHTQADSKLRS